jgi:hypothetical protein
VIPAVEGCVRRAMAGAWRDGAATWVDRILPRDVDYRQWTLSFLHNAFARRVVQPLAVFFVEIVAAVGEHFIERDEFDGLTIGEVGRLIDQESTIFHVGFDRRHVDKDTPQCPAASWLRTLPALGIQADVPGRVRERGTPPAHHAATYRSEQMGWQRSSGRGSLGSIGAGASCPHAWRGLISELTDTTENAPHPLLITPPRIGQNKMGRQRSSARLLPVEGHRELRYSHVPSDDSDVRARDVHTARAHTRRLEICLFIDDAICVGAHKAEGRVHNFIDRSEVICNQSIGPCLLPGRHGGGGLGFGAVLRSRRSISAPGGGACARHAVKPHRESDNY